MKKRAFYLLACIFLSSLSAFGQQIQAIGFKASSGSQTTIDLERSIRLEKDSKTEEITIAIKKESKVFELYIRSAIEAGELAIEIYDPNGVKQGNFAVGTQLNSEEKEIVIGNIRKSLVEPEPGNWKVKIFPNKASGKIDIKTSVVE